ncbi:MAG: hypothetical protein IPL96_05770 [Holophagaceae bacterium]|nr:hypothetical protein [Holophagaceae bacterium]
MFRSSLRSAALALALATGFAPAASAQGVTHLNVPAKQMVRLSFTLVFDGTNWVPNWTETVMGTNAFSAGFVYQVSKEHNLVITDAEFAYQYLGTAGVVSPVVFPVIQDPGLTNLYALTRVKSSLTAAGREVLNKAFTAGTLIPAGYQIDMTMADQPNHKIVRAYFYGYYVD